MNHQCRATPCGPPSILKNKVMREEGLQIVGEHIYAPQGVNKYLKSFWEKKLAKGELCREPTPP